MKLRPDKNQITWGITIFLTAVAVLMAFGLLFNAKAIGGAIGSILRSLQALTYGIVIGYILTPVVNFFEKKFYIPYYKKRGIDIFDKTYKSKKKHMRYVTTTIAVIIFLLFVVGVLVLVIPQLIESVSSIASSMPKYIKNIENLKNNAMDADTELGVTISQILNSAYDWFNNFVEKTVLPGMSTILSFITEKAYLFIKGIVNFIIGIIIAVYVLCSKETFCSHGKKVAYALFNENIANEIIGEFRHIHNVFNGFLVGKIIDSIIIGILCFIGTSIIGTPYAVLVSALIGVTNIVPIFGPYIGLIVGSILIVLINPIQALYFIIFVFILQQFDGNILGPKILGSSTGISSFWVLVALLFFGGLFGLVGWIIGVPLCAVLYSGVKRIINYILVKKGLPSDSDEYVNIAYFENGEVHKLRDGESTKFYSKRPESTWKQVFGFSNTKADKISKMKSKEIKDDNKE